jgi:hypothetical protein
LKLKTYYVYPNKVINTITGVSPSSLGWTFQPPKGAGLIKKLLRGKTLSELYAAMESHGITIDERCDESEFVNPCPSKLSITANAVSARIIIVDELGVRSMPVLRFEFTADSIPSFTGAVQNALKVLDVEQMNNRLNQLVKYLGERQN